MMIHQKSNEEEEALYYNLQSNNTEALESWPRLTIGSREESKMINEKGE